jgi:hypothetical protein
MENLDFKYINILNIQEYLSSNELYELEKYILTNEFAKFKDKKKSGIIINMGSLGDLYIRTDSDYRS